MRWFLAVLTFGLAIGLAAPATFEALGQDAKAKAKGPVVKTTVSFKEDIFPIFRGRCIDCHQPAAEGFEKSGLDLRTYEGLMKGTKFGAMVLPRDAASSNLLVLLDWRASPELRMPHGSKKLSTCDRDAIRRWINDGALNN